MNKFFKRKIKSIRQYDQIAGIGEIARRYFAMNSFDGVLTILGILIGSFFGGIREARIVVSAGLGASIALMVSGLWGTYLTEHAERTRGLKELEGSILIKLEKTDIGKASKVATVIVALVNGLSPFIASILVLMPFFLSGFFDIMLTYYISIGIAFLILFSLGMFLGKISKENMIKMGLKMVLAGIVSAALGFLFIR
jgi:predicted membrane protein (TIGR00267 family)